MTTRKGKPRFGIPKTNKFIIRGQTRRYVEASVKRNEAKGCTRVNNMEIVEDIGFDGDVMYVCVMQGKEKPSN